MLGLKFIHVSKWSLEGVNQISNGGVAMQTVMPSAVISHAVSKFSVFSSTQTNKRGSVSPMYFKCNYFEWNIWIVIQISPIVAYLVLRFDSYREPNSQTTHLTQRRHWTIHKDLPASFLSVKKELYKFDCVKSDGYIKFVVLEALAVESSVRWLSHYADIQRLYCKILKYVPINSV